MCVSILWRLQQMIKFLKQFPHYFTKAARQSASGIEMDCCSIWDSEIEKDQGWCCLFKKKIPMPVIQASRYWICETRSQAGKDNRGIQGNCKSGIYFVFWARDFLTTWRNPKQEFFDLGPSHIPTRNAHWEDTWSHILAFALCTSSVAD